MKITVLGDGHVLYERTPGPLTIEAPSADTDYSAFDMLASAVAVCTYSTVQSWATHANIGTDDLSIEVRTTYAEHPHRAGALDIALHWPSLPPEREAAAHRAAELCPVHQTLRMSPTLNATVVRGAAPATSGAA